MPDLLQPNRVLHLWVWNLPPGCRQQQDLQYAKYLNRFGPGAVIYWFGFYEGLEDVHPDVLVLANFPHSFDILQLRQMALPD